MLQRPLSPCKARACENGNQSIKGPMSGKGHCHANTAVDIFFDNLKPKSQPTSPA
jgi:hypothetical protein